MMDKKFIYLGLFVGSTLGGLIPQIWGSGAFSFSSIFLSAVGGIAGIYFGYKISQ